VPNDPEGTLLVKSPVLTLVRRALVAVSLAGMIGGVLRVRGTGGVPPQGGGWRELRPDEMAARRP
jgi:hypothetical protein